MKSYVNLVRTNFQYPYASIERAVGTLGLRKTRVSHMDKDTLLVTWTPWSGSLSQITGEKHRKIGTWLVMENGYIPKINGIKYYAVGQNGFNGMGDHRADNSPSDRWKSFSVRYQRKQNKGYILVIGQFGHKDTRISMPINWPDQILNEIRMFTDRPIVYRPKPERGRLPVQLYTDMTIDEVTPLDVLISSAYAVVVYSSKAAIYAMLSGVPVIVTGQYSIVKHLCCNDIADIEEVKPVELEQFWYDLAYMQWSEEEIASGVPFRRFM